MISKCLPAIVTVLAASCAGGQVTRPVPVSSHTLHAGAGMDNSYVLGPGDEITVRAVGIDEINDRPVRIDTSGHLRLPLVGQLKAAGTTVADLQAALTEQLKMYVLHPDVSVSVTQFHSQPVSVLGAVRNPGVYQLQGRKTLVEVLSLASGLDNASAGSTVKITRHREFGDLPLETAHPDATGEFTTAEVDLKSILDADHPGANIVLKPYDVITVPRAELVYVVGQVQRAGGFPLGDRKSMTVLEALSQAGGTDRGAAPQHARILRRQHRGADRTEVAIDLKKILAGRAPDVLLEPNDILFVPSSAPKAAALRAAEAAIQLGTGVVIWRR